METEGSGRITLDESQMRITGENSIQNVADTLKEVLNKPNTFRKSISMLDGDVPVADDLDRLSLNKIFIETFNLTETRFSNYKFGRGWLTTKQHQQKNR